MKKLVSEAYSDEMEITNAMFFLLDITDTLLQQISEAKDFLKKQGTDSSVSWKVDAHLYEITDKNQEDLFDDSPAFYLKEHPEIFDSAREVSCGVIKLQVSFEPDNFWSIFLIGWIDGIHEVFSDDLLKRLEEV